MGRRKLKIEKLQNYNARQATYAKRKPGLMKKAKELQILCDICILLLMFSPTGKPYLYTGKHSIEEVLDKFVKLTHQERAKRMLENLEALGKTCLKSGHYVDISEFLNRRRSLEHYQESRRQSFQEDAKMMGIHLSELQRRLSFWKNIEKINSVDNLNQLEISLRQSLAQIRAHKENMLQHQQQKLRSLKCKNQLQNVTDRDFGMEREQQLEKFPCFPTNENMNVPRLEEHQFLQRQLTNMDITCSESLSFGNYSGQLQNIPVPDLKTDNIPRSSADPHQQLKNLNCLNDEELQQLAPVWNSLASLPDCHSSQSLETSYRPQVRGNGWASSSSAVLPHHVFDEHQYSREYHCKDGFDLCF